jgi:hypothetical protein
MSCECKKKKSEADGMREDHPVLWEKFRFINKHLYHLISRIIIGQTLRVGVESSIFNF